jgi:hypothetical protein
MIYGKSWQAKVIRHCERPFCGYDNRAGWNCCGTKGVFLSDSGPSAGSI